VLTAPADVLPVVLLLSREVTRVGAFHRDVLGLPLQEEQHDGRHTHHACRPGTVYFTIQPATDSGRRTRTGATTPRSCASRSQTSTPSCGTRRAAT
jgi:hypothetical protein